MSAGKLGRRPAIFTRRSVVTAAVMASHLGRLGAPPSASVDRISAIGARAGGWGMMMNDVLGCCTCSDSGHALMLRTGATGSIIVPTDADIEKMYQAFGYMPGNVSSDNGAAETDVCEYLKTTGLIGHKIDDYANLNPTDLDGLRWAVELFGSCRLGINLPNSAIDQFNNGQPWDVVADDGGIAGGHDVLLVWYDDDSFGVVTWGKEWPTSAAFLRKYLEEAHPELAFDWIAANGNAPSGFDLNTLVSDLQSIAA